MSDSPESDLQTDSQSTDTSTAESQKSTSPDADADVDADADEPEPVPEASDPEPEPESNTTTESEQSRVDYTSAYTSGSTPDSDTSDGESSIIFADSDFTRWAFYGFTVFAAFCGSIALGTLGVMFAHGVHHAPQLLWIIFVGSVVLFIAVVVGGAAKLPSVLATASQVVSENQTDRHSEKR